MNFSTKVEPNTGSAGTSRLSAPLRLGISQKSSYLVTALLSRSFGPLCAVLRSALLPVRDTRGIQRATDHVIADARKVLYTTTTNQHNRMLLKVMPNARDISSDFDSVGQTHTSNLPQRRIRLLRGGSVHASADTTLLRAALQRRAGRFPCWRFAPFTHKLIECRH